MRAFKVALVIGLSLIATAPAYATVLNWEFGGGEGSGQLTTSDTATASGGFLVTAFTGSTYLGTITALLAPGTVGNDNLLYLNRPASSPVFGSGIGLKIGATNYDLFTSPITFQGLPTYQLTGGSHLFSFGVTPVAVVAVHEPATWAMTMSGVGIAGILAFAVRHRKRPTAQPA